MTLPTKQSTKLRNTTRQSKGVNLFNINSGNVKSEYLLFKEPRLLSDYINYIFLKKIRSCLNRPFIFNRLVLLYNIISIIFSIKHMFFLYYCRQHCIWICQSVNLLVLYHLWILPRPIGISRPSIWNIHREKTRYRNWHVRLRSTRWRAAWYIFCILGNSNPVKHMIRWMFELCFKS